MSTVNAPIETRVCSKCYRTQPIGEFRTLESATNRKSPECKSCRNRRLRTKTTRTRRQALRATATEIRRSESTERILNLVDSLCLRLGGVTAVIEEFVALLKSSETPEASKVKMLSTIFAMIMVAEKTELAKENGSTPEDIVRTLHRRRQLGPILQAMFLAGELGFDDLDPPPVADA